MWRALLLACGACSFSASTTPGAGELQLDAATAGSEPEMQPAGACAVIPAGAPVGAGAVGPGGGSVRDDVVCAAGELPIGFDFIHEGGAGTIATHVRCGTLARDAAGAITTTPKERVGDPGLHGTCIITAPTPAVPEQTCPTGHVLVGITVDNIGSSYSSFSMRCRPLGANMQLTGSPTTITFPGSGTANDNLQTVDCGAGQAILAFGLKSGCDQELLDIRCSTLACN